MADDTIQVEKVARKEGSEVSSESVVVADRKEVRELGLTALDAFLHEAYDSDTSVATQFAQSVSTLLSDVAKQHRVNKRDLSLRLVMSRLEAGTLQLDVHINPPNLRPRPRVTKRLRKRRLKSLKEHT